MGLSFSSKVTYGGKPMVLQDLMQAFAEQRGRPYILVTPSSNTAPGAARVLTEDELIEFCEGRAISIQDDRKIVPVDATSSADIRGLYEFKTTLTPELT